MDIQIRPWADTDSIIELTALLHQAYAALGQQGLNYTAVDQSVEITQRRIAHGQCFVAVDHHTLIGTITVKPGHPRIGCPFYDSPQVAIINQWGVLPDYQGQGVGQSLIQQAEQWAIEQKCHTIGLDTAEPAHHLIEIYTRYGYQPVGFVQWPGKTYRSVVLIKPLS